MTVVPVAPVFMGAYNNITGAPCVGIPPAGSRAGDVLIAIAAVRNGNPVVGTSGFTTIQASSGGSETGITRPLVAYLILNGPAAASYTFTGGANNACTTMALYRPSFGLVAQGVQLSALGGGNGTGVSATSTAITLTAGQIALMCLGANSGNNGEIVTYSSSVTERADAQAGVPASNQINNGRMSTALFEHSPGPGSYTPATVTLSRSEPWGYSAFGFAVLVDAWKSSFSPLRMS